MHTYEGLRYVMWNMSMISVQLLHQKTAVLMTLYKTIFLKHKCSVDCNLKHLTPRKNRDYSYLHSYNSPQPQTSQ